MAGQPKKRAVAAELLRRTLEHFGAVDGQLDGNAPRMLDYVANVVASGGSMYRIAQEISVDVGFTVNRETVNQILARETSGEERDKVLSRARLDGAHAMAEESIVITDEPVLSGPDASRAGNRARSRQWMAERANREAYGQRDEARVSISIGSLHLEALRAARPSSQAAHILPDEPAEVLEITSGDDA